MEKTIEQRAAIIAVEVIANMVQVIEHHDAETLQGIKNYIARELEKQRKIDIEKAKESFCKSKLCRPYKECRWGSEGCCSMQCFIKAMEEHT